jgi:para-nitrobenzyl esterase
MNHKLANLFLSLTAICVVTMGSPLLTTAADGTVTINQGHLQGIVTPNVIEYLGIPYAAPPVGKLRWLPPQLPAQFKGVFQATQFGSGCPQSDGAGGVAGEENCLFLNVYTPADAPAGRHLPVMVWIHGGGNTSGTGALFDPTPLVAKGVVVVTINYRLGFLGFFAHPALDAEGHLNANYGLMDQQLALRWVQQNIGAFGGNGHRVTIFGESAGGLDVYSQLASHRAAGLFHQAIAESGSYSSFQDYQQTIVSLTDSEAAGTALGADLGCNNNQTSACLRSLPVAALVNAQPFPVDPIVDGTILSQPPGAAFASGKFNRVPVISGTNHDEYRLFVADLYDYVGNPLTAAGYPAAVALVLGEPPPPPIDPFTASVLSLYPLSADPTSASIELGAVGTDAGFACPARNADLSLSRYVPTYTYEFNDENAPLDFYTAGPASFPLGAYHTSEIQYLFNLLGIPATFTPDQQKLSDTMISYWTQFAKTGNPNSTDAPVWSVYRARTDEFQSLVPPTPMAESNFFVDHLCSFWDSF